MKYCYRAELCQAIGRNPTTLKPGVLNRGAGILVREMSYQGRLLTAYWGNKRPQITG